MNRAEELPLSLSGLTVPGKGVRKTATAQGLGGLWEESKGGFLEEAETTQEHEEGAGVHPIGWWDERKREISDRGNSECRGSEARESEMCLRT